MTLPKKINIGPHTVEIIEDGNLITDRQAMGEWHPREKKILLDATQSSTEKWGTLLHEILEAAAYTYDLPVDHHVLSIYATGLMQALGSILTD